MKSLTKKYLAVLSLLIIILVSMIWFRVPWRVIATAGFLVFAALDLWYIIAVRKERTNIPTSTKWGNDAMIIAAGLLILLFLLFEHLL
jgi:hypothetical protein